MLELLIFTFGTCFGLCMFIVWNLYGSYLENKHHYLEKQRRELELQRKMREATYQPWHEQLVKMEKRRGKA